MDAVAELIEIALDHYRNGRLHAVESVCRQIVAADPCHAKATYLLGEVFLRMGNLPMAADYLQLAIQLDPRHLGAHVNLGEIHRTLQNYPDAVACFEWAIKLDPNCAAAHNNLGATFRSLNRNAKAVAAYRRAAALDPNSPEIHYNLGCALLDQRELAEATDCFRRVLQLNPTHVDAYNNLGLALRHQLCLTEAIECYRRALEIDPRFALAHHNLGNILRDLGRLEEARECFRRALDLDPDFAEARKGFIFLLHYTPDATLAQIAGAHREFEDRHTAPLRADWRPHANVRDPHRRLRLGFVSADFRRHPVAFFLIRALENLDRAQCEIVCYNDHGNRFESDELKVRFAAVAHRWRESLPPNHQQLAEQIRSDQIDILFDLAGHTVQSRLFMFARKPAPIQITWIGYEGTTGLAAMDYLLADRYVVPEGVERYYREKILRMPDGYVCYDPPAAAPEVGPLPALERGYVTFGSFNRLSKLGPGVVSAWSKILRRVPDSRLMLKYEPLGNDNVKQRFYGLFSDAGVSSDRLVLLPKTSFEDYLASYNQVDIGLDPFPFSGGATTCESLWMGVPTITWPGETFASRHTLSHLSNIGLVEMISHHLDDYVERAVALANDLPRLVVLRASLRERMAASPLCDGARFAANLMPLLRHVWRQWTEANP